MNDRGDQLTVVSNRLPIVMHREAGGWNIEPGSGGLVQAMTPILDDHGGCWVGWPGVTADDGDDWREGLAEVERRSTYDFEPVVLTRDEYRGYYRGFANSVIWPLFHGFADRCEFDPEFYAAYGQVNEKFARVLAARSGDGLLWAHDYHLIELGRHLRDLDYGGRLAFFLHIPFPSVENFTKLPWRDQVLDDLLHYDQIGFQTQRDLENFERCVDAIGAAGVVNAEANVRQFNCRGRRVEAGAFPIGIDVDGFVGRAASQAVGERITQLGDELGPYQVLLGVDRLDYSKGLLHRLRAYEKALEQNPELRQKVVFLQLVVPSRESVPEYRRLKQEFDETVGRINGRFSTPGWQPIHYLYDSVRPPELSALYRLASVALVTPLRDGMNLVSKEYCVSQINGDGVLVLSEFAGSRSQLQEGAVLVNPYDVEATARAISEAVSMDDAERCRRMESMQRVIERTDVFWWANAFVERIDEGAEARRRVVDVDEESTSMAGEGANA